MKTRPAYWYALLVALLAFSAYAIPPRLHRALFPLESTDGTERGYFVSQQEMENLEAGIVKLNATVEQLQKENARLKQAFLCL